MAGRLDEDPLAGLLEAIDLANLRTACMAVAARQRLGGPGPLDPSCIVITVEVEERAIVVRVVDVSRDGTDLSEVTL